MTRITVDVNDEWLEAAREILGTDTKVATINEALHTFALQKRAAEIIAALDSAEMDFTDSERAWRYGAGRDFTRLEENAREGHDAREDHVA
jgi:Arc/MetJ family transcription regulator